MNVVTYELPGSAMIVSYEDRWPNCCGGHFQCLSHASIFEEDIRGQILLLIIHSCAVTNIECCQGNGVDNITYNLK